ncbi:MAG: hypothetical protein ACKVWV_15750 [Planctomycetota bacterium]
MTLALLLALACPPTALTAGHVTPAITKSVVAANASTTQPTLLDILEAIRVVEEDRARAVSATAPIGAFGLDRARWRDAGLKGKFEDCRDPRYARCVVVAYWQRRCPEALARRDAEVLARIHAGGPNGAVDPSTRAYWNDVKRALDARSVEDAKTP